MNRSFGHFSRLSPWQLVEILLLAAAAWLILLSFVGLAVELYHFLKPTP
jgi:hypothetical protein